LKKAPHQVHLGISRCTWGYQRHHRRTFFDYVRRQGAPVERLHKPLVAPLTPLRVLIMSNDCGQPVLGARSWVSTKLTFRGDETRWPAGWPLPWASPPSPWSAGATQCHKDGGVFDGEVCGDLQTVKIAFS
jgi:hypothetical protein